MRKIYPPPILVFILYGLLSLTTTTLAQGCSNEGKSLQATTRTVVGYVKLNTGAGITGMAIPPIQWDSYSYINLVVNDIVNFGSQVPKETYSNLVADRGSSKTKILLSIRDYDISKWDVGAFYNQATDQLTAIVNNNNLDGLDIEFPGSRGFICYQGTWDLDRVNKFKDFFRKMRANLPKKTMMLTVNNGGYPVDGGPVAWVTDLNDVFDFLNVETYHFSLYGNYNYASGNYANGNNITSYPNTPFDIFSAIYNGVTDPKVKGKLIMGIDFGNTIQVITNQDIRNNPSISFTPTPVTAQVIQNLPQDIMNQINPISNLCPNSNNPPILYSFPWKVLSTYPLNQPDYCTTKDNWTRKFSSTSQTPWLYRIYNTDTVTVNYYFISYEDINSLSNKLALIGKTGVSISDISYDDDKSSLLNLIHSNKLPDNNVLPGGIGGGGTAGPSLPPDSNNQNPKGDAKNDASKINENEDGTKRKMNAGGIAGAVIGSIVAFTLIVGLLLWNRKNSILKSKEIPKGSVGTHTASKPTDVSSEPTRFPAPTTVIPVASASNYVTAMFDFSGKEENDLSFKKGDKIEVLERGDGPNDWWVGKVNGNIGEFPGNYVKETS